MDDDSEEEEATAIDLRSSSQAYKKPIASPPAPPPRSGDPRASVSGQPEAGTGRPRPPVPRPPVSAAPPAPPASPSAPLHASAEDDEATEFLVARPASSAGPAPARAPVSEEPPNASRSLRARGRAVPLEGDRAPSAPTTPAGPSAAAAGAEADAVLAPTEPIATVPPAPLPQRTPRPLPSRGSDFDDDAMAQTGTGSSASGRTAPRITRIFVTPPDQGDRETTHRHISAHEGGQSETDASLDPADDEATDPPRQPVRARDGDDEQRDDEQRDDKQRDAKQPDGKKPDARKPDDKKAPRPDRARTERTVPPTTETLEAEPADGTLVVDVPEGAVVFVNGLERGQGPSLKVTGIDRYAKHVVRIHCPGHLPWSGTVCLEGRVAAKVRPNLKKRER